MSVRSIILAEDSDKLRRMYFDMLTSVGFNVLVASDGEKAISLLHKVTDPHLIILDVLMPRLDGIETCIRMRKMQGLRPCPIIFLTSLSRPENMLECLRAGGDDYLMKTAPMIEIIDRVQYWSRRKSLEDGSERRTRAIKELEAMISGGGGAVSSIALGEVASDQALINHLADVINSKKGSFTDDDDTLYRFGYVVGLVETRIPMAGKNQESFERLLRTLFFKTNIILRKEVEPLLENYPRIINQSLFQKGWTRGRDEASDVDMPQCPKSKAPKNEPAGQGPTASR